ncbi:MAG: helix-turn-helix domain-containing protein [Myxococcota bacterium]
MTRPVFVVLLDWNELDESERSQLGAVLSSLADPKVDAGGEPSPGTPTVEARRHARRDSQREALVNLIEECGGNLAEVARRLGLSRGAVIYRARKFGLLRRPASAGPCSRSR